MMYEETQDSPTKSDQQQEQLGTSPEQSPSVLMQDATIAIRPSVGTTGGFQVTIVQELHMANWQDLTSWLHRHHLLAYPLVGLSPQEG